MSRSRRASLIALCCAALAPLLTQCGPSVRGQHQPTDTTAHLKPGVKGVPTADGSTITGLTCFECHTPLADIDARVRFSHKDHAERGLHCNACHGAEDHAEAPADKAGQRHVWGVSKACGACHDGQKASDKCRTCHSDTAVIKPESHKRSGFPRGHGRDDATLSCTYCHERNECANCHGLALPHPEGFARSHGTEAKAKPKVCGQCHEPNWCASCHNGLTMPHPATFMAVHGRTDQRLCAKCHDKSDCADCHSARSPHAKGFAGQHSEAAKRNQPACGVCHQQSYCDDCHGLKMPHPASFASLHGKEARRAPRTCAKCHEKTTCDSCHGREMPHADGFLKTHGKEALGGREDCGRCHQSRECQACHGTAMPHPSGFVYGHGGEARFGERSACAKCHATKFCAQCHTPEQMAGAKP